MKVLLSNYLIWKFFFKGYHPTHEIVCEYSCISYELTCSSWSSTRATDEYDLFVGVKFWYCIWKVRERSMERIWYMYFVIFISIAYVDELDGFALCEKYGEFLWCDSMHIGLLLSKVDKLQGIFWFHFAKSIWKQYNTIRSILVIAIIPMNNYI